MYKVKIQGKIFHLRTSSAFQKDISQQNRDAFFPYAYTFSIIFQRT